MNMGYKNKIPHICLKQLLLLRSDPGFVEGKDEKGNEIACTCLLIITYR